MTPEYMKGLSERMRDLWQKLEPGTDDVVLMGKVSMILAEGAQALELAAKEMIEVAAAVQTGIAQMRKAVNNVNRAHVPVHEGDDPLTTRALAELGRQFITTGARVFGNIDLGKPEALDDFHKRVARALDMSRRPEAAEGYHEAIADGLCPLDRTPLTQVGDRKKCAHCGWVEELPVRR